MVDKRKSTQAAERTIQRTTVDFSILDGRTVVLILRQGGKKFVYCGTAVFSRDDLLGNILSITPADPGVDGTVIVSECTWKGRIFPDFEYHCDLCMIPDA